MLGGRKKGMQTETNNQSAVIEGASDTELGRAYASRKQEHMKVRRRRKNPEDIESNCEDQKLRKYHKGMDHIREASEKHSKLHCPYCGVVDKYRIDATMGATKKFINGFKSQRQMTHRLLVAQLTDQLGATWRET